MSLPAFGATQPVESTLSVGVSNYREADIPQHLVAGGDHRRYDIDIRQFRLLTPIGRKWSLGLDLSQETMSGASPWATVMGPEGEPELIMSGATIDDSRTEASMSAAHYGDDYSVALGLTHSKEDDYEAIAPSLSGEWTVNDDLTTVSMGLSWSSDTIEPTDAAPLRTSAEGEETEPFGIHWRLSGDRPVVGRVCRVQRDRSRRLPVRSLQAARHPARRALRMGPRRPLSPFPRPPECRGAPRLPLL